MIDTVVHALLKLIVRLGMTESRVWQTSWGRLLGGVLGQCIALVWNMTRQGDGAEVTPRVRMSGIAWMGLTARVSEA